MMRLELRAGHLGPAGKTATIRSDPEEGGGVEEVYAGIEATAPKEIWADLNGRRQRYAHD